MTFSPPRAVVAIGLTLLMPAGLASSTAPITGEVDGELRGV
jgi:hypothetical protein